jgi:hypothetical protein
VSETERERERGRREERKRQPLKNRDTQKVRKE